MTGVTGGVRSTVGGVVGAARPSSAGSLAAGRALVQGATSGDVGQLGEAGRAFAGGVVGGVGSVVGGVAHAGQDVVGGACARACGRRRRRFLTNLVCLYTNGQNRGQRDKRQRGRTRRFESSSTREAQHVVRQRRRPVLFRHFHLRLRLLRLEYRADLAHGPVGVAPIRPGLPPHHLRRRFVAAYEPLEGRAEEGAGASRPALGRRLWPAACGARPLGLNALLAPSEQHHGRRAAGHRSDALRPTCGDLRRFARSARQRLRHTDFCHSVRQQTSEPLNLTNRNSVVTRSLLMKPRVFAAKFERALARATSKSATTTPLLMLSKRASDVGYICIAARADRSVQIRCGSRCHSAG